MVNVINKQGDTFGAAKNIGLAVHASFDDFRASIPPEVPLIAIEKNGKPLANYVHPHKAVYLLGPEDGGYVSLL